MDSSNSLLSGNLHGDQKIWVVGSVFMITGLIIAVLIPYLIAPRINSGSRLTTGIIEEYVSDGDDQFSELFSYQTQDGINRKHQNGISSSSPAYQIGDRVEVYYDLNNPDQAWIKDDQNLRFMLWVLYGLGGYFVLLGLAIILLKLKLKDNTQVEVIIGSIAALSYALPATFAYPILYYAFLNRPNFLYTTSDLEFPQESHLIGLIFSLTGIITIAAVLLMIRYYKKTGSNTFNYSK
jgi:hypothetical protein